MRKQDSTRRQFIQRTGSLCATLPFLPMARAGTGLPRRNERALVLLELAGGNDGLNTVIPFEDDRYHRLRPTLRIAKNQVLKLDDTTGLHPALGGLHRLFEEGQLTVLQGVGYPDPDRSHFRSAEIWHTAHRDLRLADTGWVGRAADRIRTDRPGSSPALAVGVQDVPLALHGQGGAATTVRNLDDFRLEVGGSGSEAARRRDTVRRLARPGAGDRGNLAFLRETATSTYRSVEALRDAVARYRSPVEYPGTALARSLGMAARFLSARLPTSVYYLRLGGFDTHAFQGPTHQALLQELGDAVSAFFEDLAHQSLADQVALFAYSEFGRRAEENGSRGTDHGAGAPCFLVSGAVRGGLHGLAPDLGGLVEGDVPHHTDFRQVYATLLEHWLGVSANHVLEQTYAPLRLFA